jgi:hypothetical protein
MLDTFTMHGAADFRTRYRYSYGWFTVPADKRKVLVYITKVDEVVTFVDEHQATYYAHADEGIEFEFIPVEKKLFMYNGALHLIQRQPARQWARGINSQNTRVTNLSVRRSEELSFGIVKAAFVRTPWDVLQQVNTGNTSVVLSDQFGAVGDTLFLYGDEIGSVLPASKQVTLHEPLFHQELVDLVERSNLGYNVGVSDGA